MRILTRQDVAQLLTMPQAIEQMKTAFGELSAGNAVNPLRSHIAMPAGDMLLMPACLPQTGLSVKAVLTYPNNRAKQLPVIQGMLLIFDPDTGTPLALMDCEELTAIRTGAAGGLAIDLLARSDIRVLGIIGAGVQARAQFEAAMVVREVDRVVLFDRSRETAEEFRDSIRPFVANVDILDCADDVATCADILVTATTSETPTFDGTCVRPGTHINAVGTYRPDRRELDTHIIGRAYVTVDSYEAAAKEAGDLVIPKRTPDAELGEIVNGTKPGRVDDQQVTAFKSVGIGVQDSAVAAVVLKQAEEQGIGLSVDMS